MVTSLFYFRLTVIVYCILYPPMVTSLFYFCFSVLFLPHCFILLHTVPNDHLTVLFSLQCFIFDSLFYTRLAVIFSTHCFIFDSLFLFSPHCFILASLFYTRHTVLFSPYFLIFASLFFASLFYSCLIVLFSPHCFILLRTVPQQETLNTAAFKCSLCVTQGCSPVLSTDMRTVCNLNA
jgi:hypothetical protein